MFAPYPPPSALDASSPGDACLGEAALLTALLANDERAWRAFDTRYSGVMLRAITRVKSRFPNLIGSADVAEIYSELCLQLLSDDKRRLRLFDPARGTPLDAWLSMLARHAAYDFLRSRRRQPQLCWLGEELSSLDALVEEAPDPFRSYCAKERARVLAALLEDLPPRDQEFVFLYYCQGLDPEQTAERLGICVGTVYSKKHKIRARIEDLLEKRLAA